MKKNRSNPINSNSICQTGIFNDFLVYDKINAQKEENLEEKKEQDDFSNFLKDFVIYNKIPYSSQLTESRFSSLFKQINEKEKEDKSEKEEKGEMGEKEDEETQETQQKEDDKFQDIYSTRTTSHSSNLNGGNLNQTFSFGSAGSLDFNPYRSDIESFYLEDGYNRYSRQMNINIFPQNYYFMNPNGYMNLSCFSCQNQLGKGKLSCNNKISKNIFKEENDKNKEFKIDMKKVLSLDDTRATLMIKNIPNKFKQENILKIINSNFKNSYDLFVLPTDSKKYKNFGYAFINLLSCYDIPYFYYIFDGKKWSGTNSQKFCEITYSNIQGKENLLCHYPKYVYYNNDLEIENIENNENKYQIPNIYKNIFEEIYKDKEVEIKDDVFLTRLPSKVNN